jgi:hypothetical protein
MDVTVMGLEGRTVHVVIVKFLAEINSINMSPQSAGIIRKCEHV